MTNSDAVEIIWQEDSTMNLLPKSFKDFKEKEYWDNFFTKRKNDAFEWYGDYSRLCLILHKYIHTNDKLLVVGCGNSQLSADLYDVGIHNITNIDISHIVIKQMLEKNKQRAGMTWKQMDAAKMEFDNDQFSVVLDKGTLDALLTDSNEQAVVQQIDKMFLEIERVVKIGGRFICISLLQKHILDKLLGWFSKSGWMIRVCKRFEENSSEESHTGKMEFPVFAVVCTKLRPVLGIEPILEAALYSEIPKRSNINEVKENVAAIQQLAFLKYHISKSDIVGEDVSLDLFVEGNSSPRYTLYIVDRKKGELGKNFSIFIVPQGRETEWLFGCEAGRLQLAESAGFQRIVVVHLNRDHQYVDLETIKAELSGRVMDLAPPGINPKTKIPFLSVGESLGKRNILYKGTSESSGDFVVEDVEGDDQQLFRRLIFLNNPNVIQSEARMISERSVLSKTKKSKKRIKWVVDPTFLACQHHNFMIASRAFFQDVHCCHLNEVPVKYLIVGLGGGGLPSFLHRNFSNAVIHVVELDPCVVNLSKEWFRFNVDERMKVIVDDGLQYITKTGDASYDVVMFDVDSKDTSIGMSCPPKSFVQMETLKAVKNILSDRGIFVLNLVCRDLKLRSEVISEVRGVFPEAYSYKVEDEVNEIIYGINNNSVSNNDLDRSLLGEKLKSINDIIKTNSGKNDEELFDVENMIKALKLLQ